MQVIKKPHEMDDCFYCLHTRFEHKGTLGLEHECLRPGCICAGFGTE